MCVFRRLICDWNHNNNNNKIKPKSLNKVVLEFYYHRPTELIFFFFISLGSLHNVNNMKKNSKCNQFD